MSRPDQEFARVFSRGFLQILDRVPSPDELRAFSRYLFLLLQWNRAHRLTGYRRSSDIVERLFLDSLLFLRWISPEGFDLLDFGAGAGIPGLPIKIAEPRIRLTLLEARRVRVSFLATAIRELELTGVCLLRGRAEALIASDAELLGAFDTVVARAAAPLHSILPLALVFLRPGGRFLASGPPPGKPLPSLPPEPPHRWETVSFRGWVGTRRFLIVEKS